MMVMKKMTMEEEKQLLPLLVLPLLLVMLMLVVLPSALMRITNTV
jgi:hypothetical protein